MVDNKVSDAEFLATFPSATVLVKERAEVRNTRMARELRPILERLRDAANDRVHCCLTDEAVQFLSGLRYKIEIIKDVEGAGGKTHVITW